MIAGTDFRTIEHTAMPHASCSIGIAFSFRTPGVLVRGNATRVCLVHLVVRELS